MRRPWGRPAAQAFAAGCVVVLASACSSSTDPIEPKDPKISAATPTAVAPTLPPAAAADTPEGAIAFVEHYVELLNYASDTGDVTALRAASDPTCKGCNSYIKLYEETYANGGYFRDPGWKVSEISSDVLDGARVIFLDIDAPGGSQRQTTTAPVEATMDRNYKLASQVIRSGSGWSISYLGRQAE
ncbi:MAG: hypothetical protein JWP10_1808 [Nocardioidaceae bacterium]|nr:hypothetical protein [Nocardioidaceae bacterium]